MFIFFNKKKIFFFWKIGKNIFENQNNHLNIVSKYADYLSYYYGSSSFFTRENVRYMKLLYVCFPIFNDKLENISWEQYKLLLQINNNKERYFYFFLSLLFNSDYLETKDFINNHYYERI